MRPPRFKIFASPGASGDQFAFNLTASNAAIILSSERYSSHSAAQRGVDSVRTNAQREDRYERRTSKADEPYFVLKARQRRNPRHERNVLVHLGTGRRHPLRHEECPGRSSRRLAAPATRA